MGNRTIERAIARKLYGDFSRAWRREKRLMGKDGKPGFRRPTFSEWYGMHHRDREMMAQSTPQDVQEYLGLDPWAEEASPKTLQEIHDGPPDGEDVTRGVMTIPMTGGDD